MKRNTIDTLDIRTVSEVAREIFKISDPAFLRDYFGTCKTVEDVNKVAAEIYGSLCNYSIRCRETGDEIDRAITLAEAKRIYAEYEADDKKNGIFEKDFYEIYDLVENEIYEEH